MANEGLELPPQPKWADFDHGSLLDRYSYIDALAAWERVCALVIKARAQNGETN